MSTRIFHLSFKSALFFHFVIVFYNKILISAKRDIGIDRLIESICEKVFEDYIRFKLKIPYSEGKMISNIMENATILDSEYIEDGVIFNIEFSEKEYVKYKQYII